MVGNPLFLRQFLTFDHLLFDLVPYVVKGNTMVECTNGTYSPAPEDSRCVAR